MVVEFARIPKVPVAEQGILANSTASLKILNPNFSIQAKL
jgi:hypothetical protein